jgi:hypothetical protein
LSDPTSPDLDLNPSDSSPPPRFHIPADYYAAPTADIRPLFPRGVKLGCGVASAVLLLIIFAAGAVVAHRGIGKLMDPLLGMMSDEISSMYAKDVTPPQRNALAGEITALREGIRNGRVPVARLDPIMTSLREAIRDQRLTQVETEKLTKEIHAVNAAPPPASKKQK